MSLSAYRLCQILGVAPRVWMTPNPFKLYEYYELVPPSGLQPGHTVLDLGCGRGRWSLALGRQCRQVTGVDVSDRALALARRFLRFSPLKSRVRFIHSTLEGAGLAAASFDRVYSFCVLEHIPNLPVVLAEAVRLLKPGGELHVTVDSLATIQDPALLEKHRAANHVCQYFTEESLRAELAGAGLEIFQLYSIMKGPHARQEFEKRIETGCKRGLWGRYAEFRRFRDEDRRLDSHQGIMILARGRKPAGPC